jgi:hypothetical protein
LLKLSGDGTGNGDLQFGFSGDAGEYALQGIDVSIRAGERIALCGRTGRFVSQHHTNFRKAFWLTEAMVAENHLLFFFFSLFWSLYNRMMPSTHCPLTMFLSHP